MVSGSEKGEILVWNVLDGALLSGAGAAGGDGAAAIPQVRLSSPITDVVWSPTHHLFALCSYREEEPPVLVFMKQHGWELASVGKS